VLWDVIIVLVLVLDSFIIELQYAVFVFENVYDDEYESNYALLPIAISSPAQ